MKPEKRRGVPKILFLARTMENGGTKNVFCLSALCDLMPDFFAFCDRAERRRQLWLMGEGLPGNSFFRLKNSTDAGLISQETRV